MESDMIQIFCDNFIFACHLFFFIIASSVNEINLFLVSHVGYSEEW